MDWLDLISNSTVGDEQTSPMYRRIASGIKRGINSGNLADGFRLPTSRELSALLKVDRSTVSRAYLELTQAGLIASHVGRGTFVTRFRRTKAAPGAEFQWNAKFSRASQSINELLIRQDLPQNGNRDMISFAGGVPTSELYPQQEFQRCVEDLLRSEQAEDMFAYSPAEGHPTLRAEVKRHLRENKQEVDDAELLIVSGSQQGLDLVGNVFVDPGDHVLMEDPSYFWANCNFQSRQANCVPIAMDSEGLRLDVLGNYLNEHSAKLLYVMPSFQNPTGTLMSRQRRVKLIELCRDFQLPILEDNFVGDLFYDGEVIPPLRALPGGRDIVIHQGTFSKALCPGLRLGWLLAPPAVLSRILLAKRTADLSTNSIAQVVLAKYLHDGLYARHLEHVRAVYRARRDAMLETLATEFGSLKTAYGGKVEWSHPTGGLFIWLKLPTRFSALELLPYAEQAGVTYSPGDLFYVDAESRAHMRLCFIQNDEQTIRTGIERLALAFKNYDRELARRFAESNGLQFRERQDVLI